LISCRREGTSLIYSAEFDAMNSLVGFMTENCCGGDAAQCMPVRKPVPSKRKRKVA
jgi:hypothetical protein